MTDDTWLGTVSDVKYKNSKSNTEDTEEEESSSTSSKNPFFVEVGDLDGLMLGQHVYMTPDIEQTIYLPKEYISDPNDPYVWIAVNNLLAKQKVVMYEEEDKYVIEEGLEPDDLIALPSSENEEGKPVTELLENTDMNTTDATEECGDADEYTEDEYAEEDFVDGDMDFDEGFDEDFGEDVYDDSEEYG